MREHLLGYLLGALDSTEHLAVERELETNLELRRQLDTLRRALVPLDNCDDEHAPPPGLALRTCEFVASQAPTTEPLVIRPSELVSPEVSVVSAAKVRLSGMISTEPVRGKWSIADWIVAAGVAAAAAVLFLPAIANSRDIARITACQEKLRSLGTALIGYSESREDRRFPAVPAEGNLAFAGIYGPILYDAGQLHDIDLLVCPDSPLAQNGSKWRLPSMQELRNTEDLELAALKQVAGGSYGYNLGVVEQGRHQAPRNLGRSQFALMSDAPSFENPALRGVNHGGRGHNILYEDGHVVYIVRIPPDLTSDHPFRNRHGQVEAGLDQHDAVVGHSQAAPFIQFVKLEGSP